MLRITCPNCNFTKNIARDKIESLVSSNVICPKCRTRFSLKQIKSDKLSSYENIPTIDPIDEEIQTIEPIEEDKIELNEKNRAFDQTNEIPTANSQSSGARDNSSALLALSGTLMAIFGVIVAFFLFSKAKSGWSGLDNKMIIGGFIILVYQGIISFLCFKVANLANRVSNLE